LVALNDGRTVTVSNRLVTLTATAQRIDGVDFWYGEQVPTEVTTIQGTLTGGTLNVPESSVVAPLPPPPPQEPPISQLPQIPQTPNVVENLATPIVSRPLPQVPSQPAAAPATPTSITQFAIAFANNLNLGGEPNEFVNQSTNSNQTQEISEVNISSLACSRVHAGLCAR
jgi:hypothetical protein